MTPPDVEVAGVAGPSQTIHVGAAAHAVHLTSSLPACCCVAGFRVQRARHAVTSVVTFLQAARSALNLTTIDWRNAEADVRRAF